MHRLHPYGSRREERQGPQLARLCQLLRGSRSPAALLVLRRRGGVKFRMLGAKGVEPRDQLGKILAPRDLTAEIKIAEHAGRCERADIEPRRIRQRLGKGLQSAHRLATLVVEPRLMVN